MSNCRSCGKRVYWVKTRSGKKMPVDYDPEISYLFDDSIVEFDPELMTSHFSTCPNADEHRARR